MNDTFKEEYCETNSKKTIDKNLQKVLVIIVPIVVLVIWVIIILRFIDFTDTTKDRVTYFSEEMMLEDLCGTWQLIFLEPRMNGTAILIFNEDYTCSYGALKENGNIEVISTYEYTINFEKSTISCENEDGKFDIINYDNNKYVRTNINGEEVGNWMLYRRIE